MSRSVFRIVLGSLSLALIVLLAFILRPVPATTSQNAIIVSGTVQAIFEGGDQDIVFSLRENDQIYYINRGLEQGLSLENLKYQLLGRTVEITYPDHWTPLDWRSQTHHLSRLRLGEETIYNEIAENI